MWVMKHLNVNFQACILECSLNVAKTRCGCTPWNYPRVFKEPGSSICDVFGNYCFSHAMKNVTSKNKCDCPNDCRSFAYSVTVASSFLNEKIYCPKDAGLLKDFQGPLGLPKMFFSYYNLIVNKVTQNSFHYLKFHFVNLPHKVDYSRQKQCEENLQFQAVVNIQLASQLVNNITRDRRITPTDQLSNIGQTLSWVIICCILFL